MMVRTCTVLNVAAGCIAVIHREIHGTEPELEEDLKNMRRIFADRPTQIQRPTVEMIQGIKKLLQLPVVKELFLRDNFNLEEYYYSGSKSTALYLLEHCENVYNSEADYFYEQILFNGTFEVTVPAEAYDVKIVAFSEKFNKFDCFGTIPTIFKTLPAFSGVVFLCHSHSYCEPYTGTNSTSSAANDPTVFEDSMNFFRKITEQRKLSIIPFFHFLTETNILKEKIQENPLAKFFSDYNDFVPPTTPESEFERAKIFLSSKVDAAFRGGYMLCKFEGDEKTDFSRIITVMDSIKAAVDG